MNAAPEPRRFVVSCAGSQPRTGVRCQAPIRGAHWRSAPCGIGAGASGPRPLADGHPENLRKKRQGEILESARHPRTIVPAPLANPNRSPVRANRGPFPSFSRGEGVYRRAATGNPSAENPDSKCRPSRASPRMMATPVSVSESFQLRSDNPPVLVFCLRGRRAHVWANRMSLQKTRRPAPPRMM